MAEKKSSSPMPIPEDKAETVAAAATGVKTSHIGGPVSERSTVKPHNRRRLITMIIGGVVAVFLVFVIVFGVLIYGYRSESPAVRAVSAVIPYPVMSVGGDYVSYHEYLFEMASIKQYYQSQASINGQKPIDFNSAAGKTQLTQLRQQILTKMRSDEVTRQLIKSNKIVVTDKQLADQYNQLVKSAGGEAKLKTVLTKVYGWSVNDLKSNLKFQLETQALATSINNNPTLIAQAKAKAQDVLNQIKAGGDFATLAKKYSQDSSAANGGDLGFITKGQSGDSALEAGAFTLQPGQVSGLIKSQYGYEIIKVNEFNADKTQVHLSEILIKSVDFNTYLKQKVDSTKSTIFISQK